MCQRSSLFLEFTPETPVGLMSHGTARPPVGCHSFPRTDKASPPSFPSPDIFSGMLCLQLAVVLFLFFADLQGVYQRMEVSGQGAGQRRVE